MGSKRRKTIRLRKIEYFNTLKKLRWVVNGIWQCEMNWWPIVLEKMDRGWLGLYYFHWKIFLTHGYLLFDLSTLLVNSILRVIFQTYIHQLRNTWTTGMSWTVNNNNRRLRIEYEYMIIKFSTCSCTNSL